MVASLLALPLLLQFIKVIGYFVWVTEVGEEVLLSLPATPPLVKLSIRSSSCISTIGVGSSGVFLLLRKSAILNISNKMASHKSV